MLASKFCIFRNYSHVDHEAECYSNVVLRKRENDVDCVASSEHFYCANVP